MYERSLSGVVTSGWASRFLFIFCSQRVEYRLSRLLLTVYKRKVIIRWRWNTIANGKVEISNVSDNSLSLIMHFERRWRLLYSWQIIKISYCTLKLISDSTQALCFLSCNFLLALLGDVWIMHECKSIFLCSYKIRCIMTLYDL